MEWNKVRRGDIFYITATEAVGSEQGGDRSAVVVSNDTGNRYAPIVEVVYLTTSHKPRMPTHVPIHSAERPSTALCEQIVTVSKYRLQRYVGRATEGEMQGIDKALHVSLGINTKGGDAMKITMITPFGEMNFDMPPAKATDLMQRAFQYASEKETLKETTELHIPALEPGLAPTQDAIHIEGDNAPELVQQPDQPKRPMSRVERMFGDFKAGQTPQQEPEVRFTSYDPDAGQEEYKGFILLKCPVCGAVRGFCSKQPITHSACRECGHDIKLHDLLPVHLKCGKCGSSFTYKTNITDQSFDYPCLECGSPVDMELNSRKTAYVTIGGRDE